MIAPTLQGYNQHLCPSLAQIKLGIGYNLPIELWLNVKLQRTENVQVLKKLEHYNTFK